MSDIKFECSHCQQHLACEEQDAGKQIQCPACNQLIQIPAEPAPAAGASRLRISHQRPEVSAQTGPAQSESLQPEPDQPAARRPLPWRWILRLGFYGVIIVAAIIAWPRLTKLTKLAPSDLPQASSLSLQTITVQFAMVDSADAKTGEASDARDKFAAALKETFGHADMTACSGLKELEPWLGQWPLGTGYKLAYNRDKSEVTIWTRVEGQTAIVKNYLAVKTENLSDLMKQAKEGIQILSKMSH